MDLSIGRSACGICPGVQSHQEAKLYLLPAISFPLTSYHSVPCSYPYSRSDYCGRGDELPAIGFSIRNHNHHNYIEFQAASLKRRVRQTDVRTATQRGRTQWRNVRWYCTRRLFKELTHPSWSGPRLHNV